MSGKLSAWHFLAKRSIMRDGRKAPSDGVTLRYTGPLKICHSGLHASLHPFDALRYSPGPILCLVECGGKMQHENDKLVCRERTIIARMDATEMLRYFARMQALSVVHLCDAPAVVLDWLMTGDEALRASAWDSARYSAWANARNSAWASAWANARNGAWASAWYSARNGAGNGAYSLDSAKAAFKSLVEECFEGPLASKEPTP